MYGNLALVSSRDHNTNLHDISPYDSVQIMVTTTEYFMILIFIAIPWGVGVMKIGQVIADLTARF